MRLFQHADMLASSKRTGVADAARIGTADELIDIALGFRGPIGGLLEFDMLERDLRLHLIELLRRRDVLLRRLV